MVISAVWKQSHWDAQAAPVGIRVRAKVEGWQPSYPFDVLISDLKYVLRYILMIKNNSPCKICKAGEPSLFRSKCSSKKTMVIDSEPFGHFFHSTTCTASSPAHMVSHVKLIYTRQLTSRSPRFQKSTLVMQGLLESTAEEQPQVSRGPSCHHTPFLG